MSDDDGLKPLCGTEEFAVLVDRLVAIEPPRIFAVVQEYGDRLDAWVVAWGMAFEDHAEVCTLDQRTWLSLSRPDSAPALFTSERESLSARLVWLSEARERLGPERAGACNV